MLTPKQRDALLQARHHDPFALLGMHTDAQGRLWVRALLPGAQQVQVLEVDALFANRAAWAERALRNIAGMGPFSVDRTIGQYIEQVWCAH